jgi:hypothetical protein
VARGAVDDQDWNGVSGAIAASPGRKSVSDLPGMQRRVYGFGGGTCPDDLDADDAPDCAKCQGSKA